MKNTFSSEIKSFFISGILLVFSFLTAQAQAQGDIHFGSEYDKVKWPMNPNYGAGGLTGNDGNLTRLALFHRSSISLQTGSDIANIGLSRLYIDAAGMVGIGTLFPSHKSTVTGNAAGDITVLKLHNDNPNFKPGYGASMVFGAQEHHEYAKIGGYTEQEVGWRGYLSFFTRDIIDSKYNEALVERMRITSDGKVGIGTVTPSEYARLDVQGGGINIGGTGNLDASLHIKQSYNNHKRLTQIHPTGVSQPGLNLMASTNAAGIPNWWSWGVLTSGEWALQPAEIFGGSQGLFIDRTGKVGIGKNTSMQYALEVNGTVHAKEVKVDLSNWSDFVFAKSYKLRSLAEVEKYIEQHQHLPDIPSAKEVEKEGVAVGEMEAKLLQKIEELTLYVIEQNKRIQALETEKSCSRKN